MPNTDIPESASFADGFLQELSARFGLDAFRPDLRQEFDYIARRYPRDLDLFQNTADQTSERLKYRALREQIEALQRMFASPNYADLGSEIYLTLRTANPKVQVDGISHLPVPNGATGEHILKLLESLLDMLSATAANVEQRNAPPKGRKPSYALESLVRNIAYLWTDILNRPFRLDYHKGSALTEAAEFVFAVAGYVAPEVSQTRLVTTMRTIIREQNLVPPVK